MSALQSERQASLPISAGPGALRGGHRLEAAVNGGGTQIRVHNVNGGISFHSNWNRRPVRPIVVQMRLGQRTLKTQGAAKTLIAAVLPH